MATILKFNDSEK